MTSSQHATSKHDLHQSLHGYSRGHRLLASSCKLSPDAKRMLRLKSDFTGVSHQAGFDTYLSLYPLKDEPFIAFARTWYANEMPRPGCVWTHTLLIPHYLLNTLPDVCGLMKYFQRPTGDTLKEYEQPICVQAEEDCPHMSYRPEQVAAVLEAVYGHPEKPVFLVSKSSEQVEDLVLSIWNQQWPALRRHFSFCTGVLELRSPDHLVDLQVIPQSDTKLIRQCDEIGIVLDAETDVKADSSQWILDASDIIGGRAEYRSFLHRFGNDAHKSRRDYVKYAHVFSSLNVTPPNSAFTISAIAKEFPGPTENEELKRKILGPMSIRNFFIDVEDVELLNEIAGANSQSLSPALLDFSKRFRTAWNKNQQKAMSLLHNVLTSPESSFYECLIEAAAECVGEAEFDMIASWSCDAALAVMRNNIRLASSTGAWVCENCSIDAITDEFQEELKRDSNFGSTILRAQTLANRVDQVERMDMLLAERIVPSLLNAGPDVAIHIDSKDVTAWQPVLSKYQDAALRWLGERSDDSNECDVFASRGLTVGRKNASNRIISVWRRLSSNADRLSKQTRLHAALVVLAAAFDDGGTEAESSCCIAFPAVYEAALSSQIPDVDWNPLRERLPRVGGEWDRCRTLRAGLIEQCVLHKWSEETVIKCTKQDDVLQKIFVSWMWNRKEKNLLNAVATRVGMKRSEATELQTKAASDYLSPFWR